MTYYLYHIPGKKVGVTTNLEDRVHKQQGYYPGEYEIIEKIKCLLQSNFWKDKILSKRGKSHSIILNAPILELEFEQKMISKTKNHYNYIHETNS